MSALNTLPVAPEFVEILADNCLKTAIDYFQANNIPDHIIELVRCLDGLNYYVIECHAHPETLQGDARDRYDIEAIIIDAVNNIAKSGGQFQGPYSDSLPREIIKAVKVKK